MRWCVDYRALNKVTKKEVFPLPIVEECLDALSGNMWFSKLDATCGYWQVKIKEEDNGFLWSLHVVLVQPKCYHLLGFFYEVTLFLCLHLEVYWGRQAQ